MRFDTKLVEDCFDGSRVYEYKAEIPVDVDLINALGKSGELQYFKDFPKPLFRIIMPSGTQIKGVKGETTFRVVYSKKGMKSDINRLENALQQFSQV